MKNATVYGLLGALLLSSTACKKDADVVSINPGDCALTSSYAQPINNLEGVVTFNQTVQQYVVSRTIPGTYDSVDIGVVCGDLPADFKVAGTKVRFSGIYRGYRPAPAAPAGTTYYYLEVSALARL